MVVPTPLDLPMEMRYCQSLEQDVSFKYHNMPYCDDEEVTNFYIDQMK